MTVTERAAPPVRPGVAPASGPFEALAALVDGAAGAPGDGPRLVSATARIDPLDPIACHAAATALGAEASLWLQPEVGLALVAIDAAWTAEESGPDRFREVARAWSALVADAVVNDGADNGIVEPAGDRIAGPLLVGGFGFWPEPARTAAWAGFESARLSLPALLVTIGPGGAWLTASTVREPGRTWDGAARKRVVDLTARWAAIAAAADGPSPAGADSHQASLEVEAEVPDAREWRATVARLAGAVGRGRIDKAVLARRQDLIGEGPIDVPAVLRRLAASAPESTVFAFGRSGRTFLGATPERLARSVDREFATVALAGSIGRGSDPAEDDELAAALLASEKDREEQAVVVERLREVLAPITDRLDIPVRPSVVRLRHIQHLATRIGGTLSERAGVLDLVERLHPTPAVGGAPRELALELIAHEERMERGWYAGPVGWVDRNGDGEFVVAIRSGVIEGRSASLFAGCGIVADSEPEREWEESRIKLRTLASALGVVRA